MNRCALVRDSVPIIARGFPENRERGRGNGVVRQDRVHGRAPASARDLNRNFGTAYNGPRPETLNKNIGTAPQTTIIWRPRASIRLKSLGFEVASGTL